eukprot:gene5069-56649_t
MPGNATADARGGGARWLMAYFTNGLRAMAGGADRVTRWTATWAAWLDSVPPAYSTVHKGLMTDTPSVPAWEWRGCKQGLQQIMGKGIMGMRFV